MPDYGNVPEDDVMAIENAVQAAARVAAQLPPNAPPEWRTVAYEAILAGILADWVANQNTEAGEDDAEDLANLLRLAADTALAQGEALRDVTFGVVLHGVMADWVENWKVDDSEYDDEDE